MNSLIENPNKDMFDDYLSALDRMIGSGSLADFIKEAWHQVEPETQLIWGWHLDAICEHLEAASRGEILKLIINIPPRHTKSNSVAVMWPAWEWTRNPGKKWLFSSYSGDLSIRDSVKCRRLVQSKWYQDRWGDKFEIISDQNQKMRFENDHAGYRLCSSVRGKNTGEGGDYIVCFPYDIWVITNYGPIQIGQIVEERIDCEILSFNHDLMINEFKPIEEYEINPPKDLIEIELDNGEILRCTEDHKIFVEKRGYIFAMEIQEGDKVIKYD